MTALTRTGAGACAHACARLHLDTWPARRGSALPTTEEECTIFRSHCKHVDTWTDRQARLVAVRYMVMPPRGSLTFSGTPAARWSERAPIGVLMAVALRRAVA